MLKRSDNDHSGFGNEALRPTVYTIRQFAKLAGIGLHSAYKAARDGTIPTVRFGRRIVVPKAALDAILDGEEPHVEYPPRMRGN